MDIDFFINLVSSVIESIVEVFKSTLHGSSWSFSLYLLDVEGIDLLSYDVELLLSLVCCFHSLIVLLLDLSEL